MAGVTTENHRSVQSRCSLGGAPGSSIAPVVRPVRLEPSWGRVLLTTVELWISRHAGFPSRRSAARLALALAAAAAVALGALQLTGAFSRTAPRAAPRAARPSVSSHPAARRVPPPLTAAAIAAAAARSAAAAWIAGQVDSAAIIGCDPAMCAALQAQGVSASRLTALESTTAGLLRTDVIATLAAEDNSLVDRYAPGGYRELRFGRLPDRDPRGGAGRGSVLSIRLAGRSECPRERGRPAARKSSPQVQRGGRRATAGGRSGFPVAGDARGAVVAVHAPGDGVRRFLPRRSAAFPGGHHCRAPAQPGSRRRWPPSRRREAHTCLRTSRLSALTPASPRWSSSSPRRARSGCSQRS